MTIKVSFNVTNITYDLFTLDGEEIKSTRYYAILLHKRTEKYINNYLLKIRYRFTIKEIAYEGGYGCVFFDMQKKMCSIYDVRPSQCRTFPFWEYFKENIDEVVTECPGIIRF